MHTNALIIFVKNPIPGKTKTRLAASVGHETALKMYHQLVGYTREQTEVLGNTTRYVFYSDHVSKDDGWPNDTFVKKVQFQGDLGQRMTEAFRDCLDRGHERVLIIGSDCPGITTELLQEAFERLKQAPVVIGPATDGGFYLLGMRQFTPELFQDIEYSSGNEGAQTVARAQGQGLEVSKLPAKSDVDYIEDWEAYGWPKP